MFSKTIMVALITGTAAILLGLWSGLDRLIEELRSLTPMGMLQPITPSRPRNTVTRQERMCFIAFGAIVILLAFYALLRGH
ncbi:MAG: hypothetical protein ABSB15_08550 [Bryobacteraceae bacterium]|jgi:hypothetical protein